MWYAFLLRGWVAMMIARADGAGPKAWGIAERGTQGYRVEMPQASGEAARTGVK